MKSVLARLTAVASIAAVAAMLVGQDSQPASRTSDEEAAFASAPAVVKWADNYEAAKAEAKTRNVPLVVIYLSDYVPASEGLAKRVLGDLGIKTLLADFAAVKIDANSDAGRPLFEATKQANPPLTQIFAPAGELLDSFPGGVSPEFFENHLKATRNYCQAADQKPQTPQSKWEAAQARIVLSTRAKAIPLLDELAKAPPEGVAAEQVKLAKAQALLPGDKPAARKLAEEVLKSAGDKFETGGEAMLLLASLAEGDKDYKAALDHTYKYIKTFPKGPKVGLAYYRKAILEMQLNDRPAAVATLKFFVENYREDPGVGAARELLQALSATPISPPTSSSAPASKPTSAPTSASVNTPMPRPVTTRTTPRVITSTQPAGGPGPAPAPGPEPITP